MKRFKVEYPYPPIAALLYGEELIATFEPGWEDFAEQLAFERNKELDEEDGL